jgi:hypothetical protein
MTLITDSYRAQLAQLHKERPDFGTSSAMYAPIVKKLIAEYKPKQFVDYGGGKCALRIHVSVPYIPYDPAIEEISAPPGPADMVMTSDVLEHLEPECLDSVMDDLQRVTRKIGFHVVHTGAALHHLPNGRNAHIIQQPPEWWLPKFIERFDIIRFDRMSLGFMILVAKKGSI